LIEVLPSFNCGVTSTGSHFTGAFNGCQIAYTPMGLLVNTLAAAKISFTDCEISGPIPSPSIKLTVYRPFKVISTHMFRKTYLHPIEPKAMTKTA
jgi:hypothetical protein